MAQTPFGNPAEEFVYSTINFDEPMPVANRKETMFGLIISFLVRSTPLSFRLVNSLLPCYQFLSWVCCSLRLYTRLVIVRAAWWDDFFVALYLVSRHLRSIDREFVSHWLPIADHDNGRVYSYLCL